MTSIDEKKASAREPLMSKFFFYTRTFDVKFYTNLYIYIYIWHQRFSCRREHIKGSRVEFDIKGSRVEWDLQTKTPTWKRNTKETHKHIKETLFCVFMGLFCVSIGLLCVFIGLLCVFIGLFCVFIGLFVYSYIEVAEMNERDVIIERVRLKRCKTNPYKRSIKRDLSIWKYTH